MRDEQMSFPDRRGSTRKVRIHTGRMVPSRPGEKRDWEKKPETVLIYVGPHQAMEVKP